MTVMCCEDESCLAILEVTITIIREGREEDQDEDEGDVCGNILDMYQDMG